MKPKETLPLLSALAASAPAVPPLAILGVALGIGLLWLASDENKKIGETEKPSGTGIPGIAPTKLNVQNPPISPRRVSREDVAEALAYGAKLFSRKEAVESLKSLGFQKSTAYKAISPEGRFAALLEFTPDGLIEWKG